MKNQCKSCGCTHTHTHTHTHTCTFNELFWSKGGSREQLEEVSILPHDCK